MLTRRAFALSTLVLPLAGRLHALEGMIKLRDLYNKT